MNNDNQTPSEKTIQDLTETLDLKDQLIEDQKRHLDNKDIIITDLQTELSFKVAEYSFLDEKTKKQEVEILEKGIEIEGLKQKNITLRSTLEEKKKDLLKAGTTFFEYRKKSTERIDNLETGKYWMWVREGAMAITILGFIVCHFSN